MEMRLAQMAEAAPLSFLARLPAVMPGNLAVDPGLPYGLTVRQFLDRLKERPLVLQRKWRSDILLLTFPAWFNEEETKVPWTQVKSLRQAEAASDGWLSLQELVAAAAQLSVPQLQRLIVEFPVVAYILPYRDLFALMARSPQIASQLRSAKGAPVAELLPALRSIRGFEQYMQDGTAATIRLEEKAGGEILLSLLSADGKMLTGVGFRMMRRSAK